MRLDNFDADRFLRETWQQKPLLIRSPWNEWNNPLEPDELAGLACEPGIESRLVTQSPDRWELEHGPLAESRFAELVGQPWPQGGFEIEVVRRFVEQQHIGR